MAANVASLVWDLAKPVAEGLGLSLWDVVFVKEGARRVLRITIDKETGVTIDDCEAMHRAMDPILDEADPIETSYDLEVSSPGIERELRTDAHVLACLGETVDVRLFAPVDGVRTWRGTLAALAADRSIVLELPDGAQKSFPRETVAKMTTVFEF